MDDIPEQTRPAGPAVPSGPPGYSAPPGYPAPASYGTSPGYSAPPAYGSSPGYPAPAGYGSPPGYGAPPSYGAPPGYPAQSSYLAPPYLNVPQPKPKRVRRLPLLAAVVALALAVGLGLVAVQQYRTSRTPAQVAQRYFDAVASGRASDAIGFGSVPPRGPYLTDVVLAKQLAVARIRNIHVDGTEQHADQAVVSVSYDLVSRSTTKRVQDRVALLNGSSGWRLKAAAPQVSVNVETPGEDRLTFAGGSVPSDPVRLFPGALPLATDSSSVTLNGLPNVRVADDENDLPVDINLTAQAKAQLTTAFKKALGACLSGKSSNPNCPEVDDTRPVPGTLRGSVPASISGLSIALDSSGGGEITLAGEVSVHGSWKVWDFNNQMQPRSGETDLNINATASVRDLSTIYWRTP